MAYTPTQLEVAAGRMVDLAFPAQTTPSRSERIAQFEMAQGELARLSQEAYLDLTSGNEFHHAAIVPLGIYATRTALESYIKTDHVGLEVADLVAEELQELCTHLHPRIKKSPKDGQTLGFAAEPGVANMIWSGIAEQRLGLKYGFLMGVCGHDRRRSGLKRDVDMVVKADDSHKHVLRKVQIKASSKRARSIYDDDIIVIAAQDLVGTPHVDEAVIKLLGWNNVRPDQKAPAYRRLEEKLKLVRK